ncbi:unnamed protein product [Clonostachys rosea]|uniref:Uncharacterized protein n=1 Tax=Bionectria ochroleuca TaxID=29856 RepID=A0ABY6TWG4_BIOOC|nr:unnamed protein product [Clonostachys rosea]
MLLCEPYFHFDMGQNYICRPKPALAVESNLTIHRFKLRSLLHPHCMDCPSSGGFGDVFIVWNRLERNINLFAGRLCNKAVDQYTLPGTKKRYVPSPTICIIYLPLPSSSPPASVIDHSPA